MERGYVPSKWDIQPGGSSSQKQDGARASKRTVSGNLEESIYSASDLDEHEGRKKLTQAYGKSLLPALQASHLSPSSSTNSSFMVPSVQIPPQPGRIPPPSVGESSIRSNPFPIELGRKREELLMREAPKPQVLIKSSANPSFSVDNIGSSTPTPPIFNDGAICQAILIAGINALAKNNPSLQAQLLLGQNNTADNLLGVNDKSSVPDGSGLLKYCAPDISSLVFDREAGYKFDSTTGLHYDANSGLFINLALKIFLRWDSILNTYLRVDLPGSGHSSGVGAISQIPNMNIQSTGIPFSILPTDMIQSQAAGVLLGANLLSNPVNTSSSVTSVQDSFMNEIWQRMRDLAKDAIVDSEIPQNPGEAAKVKNAEVRRESSESDNSDGHCRVRRKRPLTSRSRSSSSEDRRKVRDTSATNSISSRSSTSRSRSHSMDSVERRKRRKRFRCRSRGASRSRRRRRSTLSRSPGRKRRRSSSRGARRSRSRRRRSISRGGRRSPSKERRSKSRGARRSRSRGARRSRSRGSTRSRSRDWRSVNLRDRSRSRNRRRRSRGRRRRRSSSHSMRFSISPKQPHCLLPNLMEMKIRNNIRKLAKRKAGECNQLSPRLSLWKRQHFGSSDNRKTGNQDISNRASGKTEKEKPVTKDEETNQSDSSDDLSDFDFLKETLDDDNESVVVDESEETLGHDGSISTDKSLETKKDQTVDVGDVLGHLFPNDKNTFNDIILVAPVPLRDDLRNSRCLRNHIGDREDILKIHIFSQATGSPCHYMLIFFITTEAATQWYNSNNGSIILNSDDGSKMKGYLHFAESGNWNCYFCNSPNFLMRTLCHHCYQARNFGYSPVSVVQYPTKWVGISKLKSCFPNTESVLDSLPSLRMFNIQNVQMITEPRNLPMGLCVFEVQSEAKGAQLYSFFRQRGRASIYVIMNEESYDSNARRSTDKNCEQNNSTVEWLDEEDPLSPLFTNEMPKNILLVAPIPLSKPPKKTKSELSIVESYLQTALEDDGVEYDNITLHIDKNVGAPCSYGLIIFTDSETAAKWREKHDNSLNINITGKQFPSSADNEPSSKVFMHFGENNWECQNCLTPNFFLRSLCHNCFFVRDVNLPGPITKSAMTSRWVATSRLTDWFTGNEYIAFELKKVMKDLKITKIHVLRDPKILVLPLGCVFETESLGESLRLREFLQRTGRFSWFVTTNQSFDEFTGTDNIPKYWKVIADNIPRTTATGSNESIPAGVNGPGAINTPSEKTGLGAKPLTVVKESSDLSNTNSDNIPQPTATGSGGVPKPAVVNNSDTGNNSSKETGVGAIPLTVPTETSDLSDAGSTKIPQTTATEIAGESTQTAVVNNPGSIITPSKENGLGAKPLTVVTETPDLSDTYISEVEPDQRCKNNLLWWSQDSVRYSDILNDLFVHNPLTRVSHDQTIFVGPLPNSLNFTENREEISPFQKILMDELEKDNLPFSVIRVHDGPLFGAPCTYGLVGFNTSHDAAAWHDKHKAGLILPRPHPIQEILKPTVSPKSGGNAFFKTFVYYCKPNWECRACHNFNFGLRSRCYNCLVPKEPGPPNMKLSTSPTNLVCIRRFKSYTARKELFIARYPFLKNRSKWFNFKILKESSGIPLGTCILETNNSGDAQLLYNHLRRTEGRALHYVIFPKGAPEGFIVIGDDGNAMECGDEFKEILNVASPSNILSSEKAGLGATPPGMVMETANLSDTDINELEPDECCKNDLLWWSQDSVRYSDILNNLFVHNPLTRVSPGQTIFVGPLPNSLYSPETKSSAFQKTVIHNINSTSQSNREARHSFQEILTDKLVQDNLPFSTIKIYTGTFCGAPCTFGLVCFNQSQDAEAWHDKHKSGLVLPRPQPIQRTPKPLPKDNKLFKTFVYFCKPNWKCRFCSKLNFGLRTNCFNCLAAKEPGPPIIILSNTPTNCVCIRMFKNWTVTEELLVAHYPFLKDHNKSFNFKILKERSGIPLGACILATNNTSDAQLLFNHLCETESRKEVSYAIFPENVPEPIPDNFCKNYLLWWGQDSDVLNRLFVQNPLTRVSSGHTLFVGPLPASFICSGDTASAFQKSLTDKLIQDNLPSEVSIYAGPLFGGPCTYGLVCFNNPHKPRHINLRDAQAWHDEHKDGLIIPRPQSVEETPEPVYPTSRENTFFKTFVYFCKPNWQCRGCQKFNFGLRSNCFNCTADKESGQQIITFSGTPTKCVSIRKFREWAVTEELLVARYPFLNDHKKLFNFKTVKEKSGVPLGVCILETNNTSDAQLLFDHLRTAEGRIVSYGILSQSFAEANISNSGNAVESEDELKEIFNDDLCSRILYFGPIPGFIRNAENFYRSLVIKKGADCKKKVLLKVECCLAGNFGAPHNYCLVHFSTVQSSTDWYKKCQGHVTLTQKGLPNGKFTAMKPVNAFLHFTEDNWSCPCGSKNFPVRSICFTCYKERDAKSPPFIISIAPTKWLVVRLKQRYSTNEKALGLNKRRYNQAIKITFIKRLSDPKIPNDNFVIYIIGAQSVEQAQLLRKFYQKPKTARSTDFVQLKNLEPGKKVSLDMEITLHGENFGLIPKPKSFSQSSSSAGNPPAIEQGKRQGKEVLVCPDYETILWISLYESRLNNPPTNVVMISLCPGDRQLPHEARTQIENSVRAAGVDHQSIEFSFKGVVASPFSYCLVSFDTLESAKTWVDACMGTFQFKVPCPDDMKPPLNFQNCYSRQSSNEFVTSINSKLHYSLPNWKCICGSWNFPLRSLCHNCFKNKDKESVYESVPDPTCFVGIKLTEYVMNIMYHSNPKLELSISGHETLKTTVFFDPNLPRDPCGVVIFEAQSLECGTKLYDFLCEKNSQNLQGQGCKRLRTLLGKSSGITYLKCPKSLEPNWTSRVSEILESYFVNETPTNIILVDMYITKRTKFDIPLEQYGGRVKNICFMGFLPSVPLMLIYFRTPQAAKEWYDANNRKLKNPITSAVHSLHYTTESWRCPQCSARNFPTRVLCHRCYRHKTEGFSPVEMVTSPTIRVGITKDSFQKQAVSFLVNNSLEENDNFQLRSLEIFFDPTVRQDGSCIFVFEVSSDAEGLQLKNFFAKKSIKCSFFRLNTHVQPSQSQAPVKEFFDDIFKAYQSLDVEIKSSPIVHMDVDCIGDSKTAVSPPDTKTVSIKSECLNSFSEDKGTESHDTFMDCDSSISIAEVCGTKIECFGSQNDEKTVAESVDQSEPSIDRLEKELDQKSVSSEHTELPVECHEHNMNSSLNNGSQQSISEREASEEVYSSKAEVGPALDACVTLDKSCLDSEPRNVESIPVDTSLPKGLQEDHSSNIAEVVTAVLPNSSQSGDDQKVT